jgi:putative intracellular protease/amidase
MHAAGNPVALVCHAPGALRNAKAQDGSPLVKGKRVTGFTNTEEQAVQLTKVMPFLVEDELKRLGGLYAKGPDWASFVQVDGNLNHRAKSSLVFCSRTGTAKDAGNPCRAVRQPDSPKPTAA